MKASEIFRSHRAEIRRVVEQCGARNPRVFGSVLSGEDMEGSDLDLLVDPTPDTTLLDIARMQSRLQALLGVPVDVITPNALPASFRERVLAEAEPV